MSESHLSRLEDVVAAGSVAEEGNEGGLEEEAEVTEMVGHTLLRQREVSSLADHEISPLDAHNGDEVARLSHLKGLGRVANGVAIGHEGSSVEGRDLVISGVPSALGPGILTSDGLSGQLIRSLIILFSISERVEESDVNLGVGGLIPTELDNLIIVDNPVFAILLPVRIVELRVTVGPASLGVDRHVGIVDFTFGGNRSINTLETEQGGGSNTVVVQNVEVGVDTGRSLDNTDLEVSEADELGIDQVIVLGGTRHTVHDIELGVLVGE